MGHDYCRGVERCVQLFGQQGEDVQARIEQSVPRSLLLAPVHAVFSELHTVRLNVAVGPDALSVGNPPKLCHTLHAVSNILLLLLLSTQ